MTKLLWPLNAWPVKPLNTCILHPNLLPRQTENFLLQDYKALEQFRTLILLNYTNMFTLIFYMSLKEPASRFVNAS